MCVGVAGFLLLPGLHVCVYVCTKIYHTCAKEFLPDNCVCMPIYLCVFACFRDQLVSH